MSFEQSHWHCQMRTESIEYPYASCWRWLAIVILRTKAQMRSKRDRRATWIRLTSRENQPDRFMDKSYKEDIPKTKRALEELKKDFSGVPSTTDWVTLRIEPLLDHVKSLERLLRSPKFAREIARLRRGVVMFHSDLVYLRQNVKALKEILKIESKLHPSRRMRRTLTG
jgi:hypothetical protein